MIAQLVGLLFAVAGAAGSLLGVATSSCPGRELHPIARRALPARA